MTTPFPTPTLPASRRPPSGSAFRRRRWAGAAMAVTAMAATLVTIDGSAAAVVSTVNVAASHDAKINQSSPNGNYSSVADLRVRDGSEDWRSLVQFDVNGLSSAASATLRLYVTDQSYDGGTVYAVSSQWSESTITWRSAPVPTGPALAELGPVATGSTVEVPVGLVPGNGKFSYMLSDGANDSALYASSESAHPPVLVLTPNGTGVTAPPPLVTVPPVTVPPVTAPPVTAPPVTAPPVTAPPVTVPPVTVPPVTAPPVTAPPVTQPPPVTSPGKGIWVDANALAARPMSGPAWENLKRRADGALGTAHIGDQNSNHDINTLAVALVAARTGSPAYRDKAELALLAVIGTDAMPDPNCEYTPSRARAMSLGRNLLSYIVAADVLDFRDARFVAWVDMVRSKDNCPNTGSGAWPSGTWLNLSEEHGSSGSNGSAMAGASRIAAAAYLGDTAEVERAWANYRRFAGDRSVGPDLRFNSNGLTWSHDSANPVAVNPKGTTKSGQRIDGAIISDIGRGGAFAWPPGYTQYQWEGTAGFVAQAQLLARAGYPAWTVQDSAPRRVIEFSQHLSDQFGTVWWNHSDWVKYVTQAAYGTRLPINGPATEGKNMAWTDWVFGP